MLNKFKSLNIFLKSSIISLFVSIVLYILTLPFIFYDLGEYSNGLLLGQFISYLFMFIIGLNDKYMDKKHTRFIVLTLIFRFVTLAIVMVIIGILYYKIHFRAFNLITVMGGYFIPLNILLIVSSVKRKE